MNAADNEESGSIYLTVTGTSAESGDDGEAGRGNRVGGLITPYRPMTMESVAGKNPVSHVGKIYNVLARKIAEDVARETDGCTVDVFLISRIGQPVSSPQLVQVRVRNSAEVSQNMRRRAREICENHLASASKINPEDFLL